MKASSNRLHGRDASGILHQRGYGQSLTSWSCSQIQYFLIKHRRESFHRKIAGRILDIDLAIRRSGVLSNGVVNRNLIYPYQAVNRLAA